MEMKIVDIMELGEHNHIVEEEFTYRGYTCVIVGHSFGHRCGYVMIEHPNKGMLFKDEIEFDLSYPITVHGGLTYCQVSDSYPIQTESAVLWLGFDCAHAYDGIDNDLIYFINGTEEGKKLIEMQDKMEEMTFNLFKNFMNNLSEEASKFDFEHAMRSNNSTAKTKEYVHQQLESVCDQLFVIQNKEYSKSQKSQSKKA